MKRAIKRNESGRTGARMLASAAKVFAAALLTFAAAIGTTAQRRVNYTNPVAAGDYPDPSVIRVGRDYYATATTSEWGPPYPILHSRDLVNWRVVSTVFRKPLEWVAGSYWAPEISEHRGRFYIYYSARRKNGPLCVAVATARRVTGPYTDHGPLICQEVGSIDGFPVTDEAGQRYLLWKEDGNSVSKPTPIWAQPLSPDGTRLVGERREILRNTEAWEKHAHLPYGDLIEGPAVVRRDGWFYMFYSGNFCCARDCNYMMGVARSRKLLGPWEKHSRGPILAGNADFKCPGHGTVVSTPDGRDFMLYHAMDAKDFVYVGRQAMLDEVTWGADGWPSINGGRGPSRRAVSPFGTRGANAEHRFFDDFTTRRINLQWQWPQNSEPHISVEPRRGGWLVLSPAAGATANSPSAAVLARPTTTGDYVATTVIDVKGMREMERAGLSAYGDAENALGVSVENKKVVVVWRREKNDYKENILTGFVENPVINPRVHLRMTVRDGHKYRFAVSSDGRNWTDVGEEMDGSYLPPWDRGVRVALVAGGRSEATGRFDFLRVEPSR